MKNKKLILINPVRRISGLLLSDITTFQPLGLAYVAAVTPPEWEVKIIDENIEPFRFEEADLVGITAFTSTINRAYEIAKIYRERGIKVVIGGIHASMLPEEAMEYADAVVVGEAEGIWEKVLQDFENGHLGHIYTGVRMDLSRFHVRPRRDLLHPKYFWQSVQTTRGCPFNCDFCSVTSYLGAVYRQRDPEDVLSELKEIDDKYIMFGDDNLIGHDQKSRQRAAKIFKGMIGLNKRWWMQTSINAIDDEEVIKLAAKAGCMFALIGFETIDRKTLKAMGKGVNLKIGIENYKKVVHIFHKYGIAVLGAFIIGNDFESEEYYCQLKDFLIRSGIDIFQITVLTPLPGTTLMERLQSEDRLLYNDFPEDWDRYRFSYFVHRGKGMDDKMVYTGNNYIKSHLYSFPRFQYRMLRSWWSLKNFTNFLATYKWNQSYKRGWQNSHYYKKYPSDFGSKNP